MNKPTVATQAVSFQDAVKLDQEPTLKTLVESETLTFGEVHSSGRKICWRRKGEIYFVHVGDETQEVEIGSWDRAQAYLDGGPNPCV